MKHSPYEHHRALVLAVNELYHDLEGEKYRSLHPEIFDKESQRWQRMLQTYITKNSHPITILDIGSGTGFVGEQLQNILMSGDTLVCTDVSATMLSIATKCLQKKYPNVDVKGYKIHDEILPFSDASLDIVTLNSVLHHIPNTGVCLQEIARVLKPGGILFVGHEPNIRFARHHFLQWQAGCIRALQPRRIAAQLLRIVGVLPKKNTRADDVLLIQINNRLLARGLITTPLSRSVIAQLVDAHSPTAGGQHRDVGFDPWTLFDGHTTALHIEHVETYNHLSKMSGRSALFAPYEKLLQYVAPRSGATFFLVARKTPIKQ